MFRGPAAREGKFFPDCRAVHTWFVPKPLDILFLDASHRVLRTDEKVKPFRIRYEAGAVSVLELPGGCWGSLNAREKAALKRALPSISRNPD